MTDREPAVMHVEASVRGRVLVSQPDAAGPIVAGFHGYGEDANSLFEVLGGLPGSRSRLVASVQALHPFYTRKGEIVASWMTGLDREMAIEDNVSYVTRVLGRLRSGESSEQPVAFVGFSQGVAMAYRAAAGSGLPCRGVVALAGDVPPELADRDLSGLSRVLIGRGTADKWYDESKLEADVSVLESAGAVVETCVFQGGHEWALPFRQAADEFLTRVLT